MQEAILIDGSSWSSALTFRGCLATILELSLEAIPEMARDEAMPGWGVTRWLGASAWAWCP